MSCFFIPLKPDKFRVHLQKYKKYLIAEIPNFHVETEEGKQVIVAKVTWFVLMFYYQQAAISAEWFFILSLCGKKSSLFFSIHNLHWLLPRCPTSEWGLCGGFPAFQGNSCRWEYSSSRTLKWLLQLVPFTTENAKCSNWFEGPPVLNSVYHKGLAATTRVWSQEQTEWEGRILFFLTRWATTHKNQRALWSPLPLTQWGTSCRLGKALAHE